MRVLISLVLAAGAIASAPAQTNSAFVTDPPLVSTNLRVFSLQDCIQLALRNNLDLQIDRFAPDVAVYTLKVDYGGWDPTMSISGTYNHNENLYANELVGSNVVSVSQISDTHGFNQGGSVLSGLLPWGLQYQFTAQSSDTDVKLGPDHFSTASGEAALNMTQPLLKNFLIDQTRLNIKVDKNRLEHSKELLDQEIMQTVTSVEQAYYDLIYDEENVVVQREAVDLAEELAAENRKKMELGAMMILDDQQAESQAATARAQWISALGTLSTQEHLMKQLLFPQYSEQTGYRISPSGKLSAAPHFLNRQQSWNTGLTMRPELLQAKLDLERQGIQLKYDKNQEFPELDLVGSYGYNGSGTVFSGALYDIQQMNHPTYSVGAQLSIPLGNIRTRNTVKADKLNLEQALLTVKRWERDIMKSIDDDITQANSAFEQVSATRAARQYAELALSAEQERLENGKSTTYTVLLQQNTLTAARGAEIQALDAYNKALSQLSVDEGSTLQRLGISVDAR